MFRVCVSQFYSQRNAYCVKPKLKTLNRRNIDLSVSEILVLKSECDTAHQEQVTEKNYCVTSVVRVIVTF